MLRDPIACKPAVMAETDDWVAMASEYRAIAVLPGAGRRARVGAGAGAGLHLGAGARLMAIGTDVAAETVDLATAPLRELNARLHALAGAPTRSRRAGASSTRAARTPLAVGLDAPVEVEIDGPRGLLLRRHEQAGDGPRPRQRGRRAWPRT